MTGVLLALALVVSPIVLRPCVVPDVKEALRCGDLLVAENPEQPEGRQIKLHFVIVPAVQAEAGRAPLFDLAGGPGLAASSSASFYAGPGSVHRQNRDVVLVDQRGTGESSPLRCPELELSNPLEQKYPVAAVRRCRKTVERHADLAQYNTLTSVADLEAVRSVLGYPQIDLFGMSYGTRLALAYIDRHPDRVRAAVLMGVVPADAKAPLWHARNAQRTLDQLFADCADDAACRTAYPALPDQWKRVVQHRSFDGPAREAFRSTLVSTASQRTLPKLIQSMSGGDFEPFRQLFAGRDGGQFSEGLYLSVMCAEDTHAIMPAERTNATAGTFAGTYRIDEQSVACKEWNVPPIRLDYATRKSEVPLLMIAGDRDYVTPIEWTNTIAAAFNQSRLVTIPKLGHFPDGLEHPECLDTMMATFYAHANASNVDASCVTQMKPAPFAH